jgi:hypothetical protein
VSFELFRFEKQKFRAHPSATSVLTRSVSWAVTREAEKRASSVKIIVCDEDCDSNEFRKEAGEFAFFVESQIRIRIRIRIRNSQSNSQSNEIQGKTQKPFPFPNSEWCLWEATRDFVVTHTSQTHHKHKQTTPHHPVVCAKQEQTKK